MKNRNLRTFLISLSMIVLGVFISLCIVLPTVNYNKESANIGNTFVNKNYESNDGKISATIQNGNQENNTTVDDGTVKFFTNEQTVSKTKNIVGETTMLTVSFKVFAVNETSTNKTIHSSAFNGKYDIDSAGLFYKIECNDDEKSKTILPGESQDFDFSLTYVITDTENFKANNKFNLTINYMADEVFSIAV